MALTDGELRRELGKHGVKIGPVTDTTRALYTKRLEKLLKDQKTKPITAYAKPENVPPKTKYPSRERSASPAVRNTRSSRSSAHNTVGYSTDEDDTPRRTQRSDSVPTTRTTRQDGRKSYVASKEFETKNLTPVHKRIKALANSGKSSSPKRRSGSLPKPVERYSDDSDDASERSSTDSWIEMESTETNTTPSLAFNSSREEARLRKFRAEIEAWKKQEEKENASSLTQRRLLTGRRSTVLQNIDQNERTIGRGALGNGIPSIASKIVTQASQKRRSAPSLVSDDSHADSVQKQPWTLNFSSFLPIGTCIFFVILGLLYATMKYDPSLNAVPAIDYNSEKKAESATYKIVNMIYDNVASHAGERECGTAPAEEVMKVSRLIADLGITANEDKPYVEACKRLIENPDWGIDFYDKDSKRITDPKNYHEVEFVDSTYPMLSGWCRFTRAVQKVLLRIILTTTVGILVWLGLVYRRYRIERQREEREQMYTMVQRILDVLRKQYDMSEHNDNVQPFLPILHVRDMIIPPQDRKKMARIWERAKQFLSASETRIRVENQTIQGEDYLVWRWIQATSPAKRHTPTSRVWQGEAFDKKGPMICPTPCLKIRNVFDPAMEVSKNWIEQIQDSILEKCQGNNEILRICVKKDSKEGLVYMLCASNQAAGRAFQALQGAWFDGRLVTVKFIHLDRFRQRFPDSVNQSRTPMRPTSAVPVSTIISPLSITNDALPYEKLYPTLPDD